MFVAFDTFVLFVALKKKIRIEDLLHYTVGGGDTASNDKNFTSNLMNLVMQFRKVHTFLLKYLASMIYIYHSYSFFYNFNICLKSSSHLVLKENVTY